MEVWILSYCCKACEFKGTFAQESLFIVPSETAKAILVQPLHSYGPLTMTSVNWSTRPTSFPAGSDNYIHTCCPSVCPSVPTLQYRPTQNRSSLSAWTVGWPSGSLLLLTPVNWCCLCYHQQRLKRESTKSGSVGCWVKFPFILFDPPGHGQIGGSLFSHMVSVRSFVTKIKVRYNARKTKCALQRTFCLKLIITIYWLGSGGSLWNSHVYFFFFLASFPPSNFATSLILSFLLRLLLFLQHGEGGKSLSHSRQTLQPIAEILCSVSFAVWCLLKCHKTFIGHRNSTNYKVVWKSVGIQPEIED